MRLYERSKVRAIGLMEPQANIVGYGLLISRKIPSQKFEDGGFIPEHWDHEVRGDRDNLFCYWTQDEAILALPNARTKLPAEVQLTVCLLRKKALGDWELEDAACERAVQREFSRYE